MDNLPHKLFPLSDRSYLSITKKDIKKIAEDIGFSGSKLAEIEIVIAEIASNIIKHTPGGNILIKPVLHGSIKGIELISIDHGPGMVNVTVMLRDGVSTTNTLGQGLGAIKRLSDDFDIYSALNWGTILLSRIYMSPIDKLAEQAPFKIHAVMLPKIGEEFCGDGFKYLMRKNSCQIFAMDGLGHGVEAYKANQLAIKSFINTLYESPAERIKIMHGALKRSRGGVGIIFDINLNTLKLIFCGLGNIAAKVLSEGKIKNCISYNGIIGHTFPMTFHSITHDWTLNNYLIITSDGINTRWDFNAISNIMKHDPSIIAASLFKNFSRGNDDCLIIIVKCNSNFV